MGNTLVMLQTNRVFDVFTTAPVFVSGPTGLTYHGKAADTWAVGVTLYCMILGQYPFLGDTLQDTYDKARKLHFLCFLAEVGVFSRVFNKLCNKRFSVLPFCRLLTTL